MADSAERPRTFFLNEAHERVFEPSRGGGAIHYVQPDWRTRAASMSQSFRDALAPAGVPDPSVRTHQFVGVLAAKGIQKRKRGADDEVPAEIHFRGATSRVFERLGMSLLEATDDGRGVVGIPTSDTTRILHTIEELPRAGVREQSHWLAIDGFDRPPLQYRVSKAWLDGLRSEQRVVATVRFWATLQKAAVREIVAALSPFLTARSLGTVDRVGQEFAGRFWAQIDVVAGVVRELLESFPSIQRIHAPLTTPLATNGGSGAIRPRGTRPALDVSTLPTVGIVDTGIPSRHAQLAQYRRAGYRNPDIDTDAIDDHGSHVASCAVFGNPRSPPSEEPNPRCRVMDVMVGRYTDTTDSPNVIDDDLIVTGLNSVAGTAPDVRVFTLSFGGPPPHVLDASSRLEKFAKLQELDNFAFARDVLLIVAAGNVERGVRPSEPYPDHADDPNWGLSVLARSFNGLVCGAYVDAVVPGGVVQVRGAPSAFTRVGPGQANAPVPSFGGPGGDCSQDYSTQAFNSGVWIVRADGTWEDKIGTSLAVPEIAARAAIAMAELAQYCPSGTPLFAATARAYLHLVAARKRLSGAFEALAARTLGGGLPEIERLRSPIAGSAVFVWQGVLPAANERARIAFPVPLAWLRRAGNPTLRVVLAASLPVNAALDRWTCRSLGVQVRPCGSEHALRPRPAPATDYTVLDRTYALAIEPLSRKFDIGDTDWFVDAWYEIKGPAPVPLVPPPDQRIAIVMELWDDSDGPVSPHGYVAASPSAVSMTRLSLLPAPVPSPVRIRT